MCREKWLFFWKWLVFFGNGCFFVFLTCWLMSIACECMPGPISELTGLYRLVWDWSGTGQQRECTNISREGDMGVREGLCLDTNPLWWLPVCCQLFIPLWSVMVVEQQDETKHEEAEGAKTLQTDICCNTDSHTVHARTHTHIQDSEQDVPVDRPYRNR